jgi:hypothetical protein
MSARCVSEPISWLRLERYALGEAPDAAAIAEHLASCAACRACLARIEADAKEVLAELPKPASPASRAVGVTRKPSAWRRATVAAGSAVALAAAVVLVLGRGPAAPDDRDRIKGAEIAFSLVRDDDTLFAEAGGTFRDGDRFKALVSCAPGTRARFDLVVYDEHGASFPLEVPAALACGNDVPLPGAFLVRGPSPMRVCLVWGDAPPDRGELERTGFDPARPRSLCKALQAAR